MVQIIENWTAVEGKVVSVAAPDVVIRIDKALDVEGFPNLMKDTAGKTITVRIPTGAAAPKPGASLKARVRRGGPKSHFFHPDDLGKG